ncbi:MAG: DUF4290 domain-containing protein [Bacteroidales bacterium]|nr:DUF4290 domain-containing protein [Bacteroidales bacterium]MCM1146920.1 DUF4290 domain-containing protein [Bacteroidales bacterium]MCM1205582.1 DUF4290 domain-containing protein [Bacillota bacterium]MCM1510307.1 DUF4290 domain-containing protein [Clostridium sp.]
MNLEGLDYNTRRERMKMPEYGRCVHAMIKQCMAMENRSDRQRGAENIVKTMELMHPEIRQTPDYKQKLWDHLAIMCDFRLDIDYPFDISAAKKAACRPSPMDYPKSRIPVRHYGNLVFQALEHIKGMPPGPARDEACRVIANQMKRDVIQHGSAIPENERILSDIAQFTDGMIQLDPEKVKLDYFTIESNTARKGKQKRKKGKQ